MAVALAATAVVVGVAVPTQATTAASASPKPTPHLTTTAQPVPRDTVLPSQSVGGPRLASTGVVTDLPPGVPAPPAIRDEAWLLADLGTGQVIAAKAAHARLLPASTLKTLTALTLIPQLDPKRTVKASAADAQVDGTRVGLVPGLTYTVGQLFQAMLMASGNDAAHALADAAGGQVSTLVAMNANAAYLGAHDTVAKTASGLDAPGETSSAYDLALIGRAALQLPAFRTYVTTKQADFPGNVDPRTHKRAAYKINNHNRLLYNYPGTIGVKNGYTIAAEHTFISAVRRGGKTYMLTEMHGLDASWHEQAAMYDWAFAHGSSAHPVGDLVAPGSLTTAPSATPTTTPTNPAGTPNRLADHAAAAALPTAILPRSVSPWVGLAGRAAALLLVALLAARATRRPSTRRTAGRRRR